MKNKKFTLKRLFCRHRNRKFQRILSINSYYDGFGQPVSYKVELCQDCGEILISKC